MFGLKNEFERVKMSEFEGEEVKLEEIIMKVY